MNRDQYGVNIQYILKMELIIKCYFVLLQQGEPFYVVM